MMNLAQLLAGSLADILAREAGNGTGLYLYRTDKAWVAFESSAYRLKRVYPRAEVLPAMIPTMRSPFVMAFIPGEVLGTKLKGVPCKRLSTDSLLYAPAPALDEKKFHAWHARLTGGVLYAPAPALDEKKFHAWHARLTGGVVKVSRSKQRKQTERS